jgi:hypothetical protein
MGRFQVTCINKRGGHFNPHERIEYIGNQAGNWKLSEPNAIGRIKGRSDSFYTLVNGREAEVIDPQHLSASYFPILTVCIFTNSVSSASISAISLRKTLS